VDQLRKAPRVTFEWDAVPDATDYSLAIYGRDGGSPILQKDGLTEPRYALENLAILDRGEFSWTVTALSHDGNRTLERAGLPAKAIFSVDLPPMQKVRTKDTGKLYGK
jgi:hypothetical protein